MASITVLEEKDLAVDFRSYKNHTPFVVVRAISDKPDETEFVEYKVFEAKAAVVCAKVVQAMVEGL